MNTIQKLENIQKLHELILDEKSGSSARIALKLNVPHRTIQRYIQELRHLGADIRYDPPRNTYYYMNQFVFNFKLEISVIHDKF